MKTETLQDLYLKELRDLYGSEKLLGKWLPKMMDGVELPELRMAIASHLNEIREQTSRLEKIFQMHGERPTIKNSKALEGILREADEDITDTGNPALREAAIVAAMQQVKHYEIAAYGTLQAYAVHLGHQDAGRLLQTTLDEERAVDRKFTEIALNHLRVEATHSA